jgi:chemotaxis protein MotB
MADNDKTRQVPRLDDDEVFEVGDASIIDSKISAPPAREKPASKLPWVLFLLAVVGAAAAVVLVVMPLQASLKETSERAAAAERDLASTKQKLSAATTELGGLRDTAAAQAKTLEEQAVQLKELTGTKAELESKLKAEIDRGDVLVKNVKGQLVVDLADQILFESGEAELNEKGKEVLKRVGETMFKAGGNVIQVGGHTDNAPIAGKLKEQFASNWELATSRAMNVVHFLEDEVKVPGEQLVVAGYGQFRPLVKNNTKENRKKNRRIEVVLLPLN